MSRVLWAVLDWLLRGLFWIGFAIGLPGFAISQAAQYLGLIVGRRRFQ